MNKSLLLFFLVCFSLALFSDAHAGDMRRGTIKGIDLENRTILFSPRGTVDTFKMNVGPKVDLSSIKPDSKVKIYVEGLGSKEQVKGIKPDKRQVIIGC